MLHLFGNRSSLEPFSTVGTPGSGFYVGSWDGALTIGFSSPKGILHLVSMGLRSRLLQSELLLLPHDNTKLYMLSTRSVTPFLHSFLLLFDRAERENGMGRQGILCSLVTSCQKVDRFVWVLLRSIQRAPFEEVGLLWIGIFPLNGYRREKAVDFGSSPEKISEAIIG